MQANPYRKFKRTSNACVACRQSKIKCSGEEPCTNCRRRLVRCRFMDIKGSGAGRRYSQALHQQHKASVEDCPEQGEQQRSLAGQRRSVEGPAQSSDAGDGEFPLGYVKGILRPADLPGLRTANLRSAQEVNSENRIWTYPFTFPPTTVINNTNTSSPRWIWLAPSSAWSFTTSLTLLVTDRLNLGGSPFNPPNPANSPVYPLHWSNGSAVNGAPDVSGLPSLDDAKYLLSTVMFHIGQIYRLLDERAFLSDMEDFYRHDSPVEKADCSRLWFVQFLLVVALGKAFLSQSKNKRNPPASKFFTRAMSLMPDHSELWTNSLIAIDVLCLAALYLYSIDHRESANIYVCQAVRIAQVEGLHTHLPEEQLGGETVRRCKNLWWTLYIMDRHFSSSLGIPVTTQDCDVTALREISKAGLQHDSTLALQVQLWHLLSRIVATIYKSERTSLDQFLEATRSILHTLAGHAQVIEKLVDVDQNSLETMSRGTRHIALLYHMCVIVATRPLLLSVLVELLDLDCERTARQGILALTKPLVATGIKSAAKTLQILSNEESILEAFLPFDMEFLYAASLHLLMASAAFPSMANSQPYNLQDSHLLFDELVHKGNRVAEARQSQLIFLETALDEFATKAKQQAPRSPCLSGAADEAWSGAATIVIDPGQEDHQSPEANEDQQVGQQGPGAVAAFSIDVADPGRMPLLVEDNPQLPVNAQVLDNIGISADDFLGIADTIGGRGYDTFVGL